MDKEIILQRSIDYLADTILMFRMNNIEKEELHRCINNVIYLFISMGREKEIKSFLVNSFGCGILDKKFLTDAQLYWLGKFRGSIDEIELSKSDLFRVADLCLLSRSNVDYDYIDKLDFIFKLIMIDDGYNIYDLCNIAKWLSIFNFECELIPIIINYVYAKYKLSNNEDRIIEYWFGYRKSVDDLVEDYNNKIQLPEIISRIVVDYKGEYYIWRMIYGDRKFIFFVVPNKIFSFRESDGINSRIVVYDLIKCKEIGGINNWGELVEYLNENDININIKVTDRIWMGINDFFKR
jgi:hypothetical protein